MTWIHLSSFDFQIHAWLNACGCTVKPIDFHLKVVPWYRNQEDNVVSTRESWARQFTPSDPSHIDDRIDALAEHSKSKGLHLWRRCDMYVSWTTVACVGRFTLITSIYFDASYRLSLSRFLSHERACFVYNLSGGSQGKVKHQTRVSLQQVGSAFRKLHRWSRFTRLIRRLEQPFRVLPGNLFTRITLSAKEFRVRL